MKRKTKKIIHVSFYVVLLAAAAGFSFYPENLNEKFIQPLQQVDEMPLQRAQLGIVLGAGLVTEGELSDLSRERVEHALKLHKETNLPLLFSGGNTRYGVEAMAMREYAVENGYDGPSYIEGKSTSTQKNALFSKELIEENSIEADTIMLITSSYHARRALATFRSVIPDSNINLSFPEDTAVLNDTIKARWMGLYTIVREYVASIWYQYGLKIPIQ